MTEQTDQFARGAYIGGGCFRSVYVSKHWPSSRVVKVATSGDEEFNRMEWALWQKAPQEVKLLLAPCYAISADGKHLLMRRTQPATLPELWNFRVPGPLDCDLHRFNLGKIRGKIVIHDYAGWGSGGEAKANRILERLTASHELAYSRPQGLNITEAERRQYGLA